MFPWQNTASLLPERRRRMAMDPITEETALKAGSRHSAASAPGSRRRLQLLFLLLAAFQILTVAVFCKSPLP